MGAARSYRRKRYQKKCFFLRFWCSKFLFSEPQNFLGVGWWRIENSQCVIIDLKLTSLHCKMYIFLLHQILSALFSFSLFFRGGGQRVGRFDLLKPAAGASPLQWPLHHTHMLGQSLKECIGLETQACVVRTYIWSRLLWCLIFMTRIHFNYKLIRR